MTHVDQQRPTFGNGKVLIGRDEDGFASGVTHGIVPLMGKTGDIDTIDTVDLRGRAVLPGPTATHRHPGAAAQTVDAVPSNVPAIPSIPEMIVAQLASTIGSGRIGETDVVEIWTQGERVSIRP